MTYKRCALLHILGAFLLIVFISIHCAPKVYAQSSKTILNIENLRFGTTYTDKTRIVLDLSDTSDFRVFALGTPDRVVIDLPYFNWKLGRIDLPQSASVKALRHGQLKPGISRIVLDVGKPVRIKNAFVLPAQSGQSHRLVVDFTNRSADVPLDKTMFGTLSDKTIADKPSILDIAELSPPSNSPFSGASRASSMPPKPAIKAKVPNKFLSSSSPSSPIPTKRKKPLIVIDAGHGGVDPGAISKDQILEKTTVLKIAKALKAELDKTGRYRVNLTRDTDVFLKLGTRRKIAHDAMADLFISIHADSIDKPDVRGASVYTLSTKASDKQSAKLAARENQADLIAGIDLSTEDKDVANILLDLSMRDTMNQSRFFADKLVKSFKSKGVKMLKTPHRHAGFAVLKAPDVPAVLIEAGFLSNAREAKMLNEYSYRQKIVGAIKNGIVSYFDHVQGSS